MSIYLQLWLLGIILGVVLACLVYVLWLNHKADRRFKQIGKNLDELINRYK